MAAVTQMGQALERAGVDVAAARLYGRAVDLLRAAADKPDPVASATRALAAEARQDDQLRAALAAHYVRQRAADLAGAAGGGGQVKGEDQDFSAPAANLSHSDARAGRPPIETHKRGAAVASDAGVGRDERDVLNGPADPGAAIPKPSRRGLRAIASADAAVARTVMDTYRVRDGRAIGDVAVGELERLRAESVQEAALLRMIARHGIGDRLAKVRDVLKVEDLQRFIQKAAEVADVL